MKIEKVYLVNIYEKYEHPILMGIYDDWNLANERRKKIDEMCDKSQTIGIDVYIINEDINDDDIDIC